MTANIRDVAEAAGVSVATVSKVLNGYSTVSQKTRDKVMRIVKETRFQPNTAARALVGRRSMTLGVFLTTSLAHPFFVNILAGMEEALKIKGYDLIYLAQRSFDKDYSFVRHCRSRNVEGVVAFGFQRKDKHFEELVESGIPSVFIDLDAAGPRAGYVSSDNRKALKRAVLYLRELGHTRIAFLAGTLDNYVALQRLDGYKKGLRAGGLPDREDFIAVSDFTRDGGYEAMKRLLMLEDKPTAVIGCSDLSAIGAMDAIREAGLSVPGDISVIGFDDLDISREIRPALTTIRQDMHKIGRKAVELLDEMIVDETIRSPSVIVGTELVVRETCRPAEQT